MSGDDDEAIRDASEDAEEMVPVTEAGGSSPWWKQPRVAIGAGVAAIFAVTGAVVVAAVSSDEGAPSSSPSAEPSVSASLSPTVSPSTSPNGQPSMSTEPEPEESEADPPYPEPPSRRWTPIETSDESMNYAMFDTAESGSRFVFGLELHIEMNYAQGELKLYSMDADTLEMIPMSPPSLIFASDPFRVSPDGNRLAYLGWSAFGVCDTRTGACSEGPRLVQLEESLRGLEWASDSSRFTLSYCPWEWEPSSVCRILVVDAATLATRELALGTSGSLSPDGSKVAWLADPEGDGSFGLWIANDDGGNAVLLAGQEPAAMAGSTWGVPTTSPRWSNDGSWIAVGTATGTRRGALHVVSVSDGMDVTVSGLPQGEVAWLEWSNNGSGLGIMVAADYWLVSFLPAGESVATLIDTSGNSLANAPPHWSQTGATLGISVGDSPWFPWNTYFPWRTWHPGEATSSVVASECLTGWKTPKWLPSTGSGGPTRAVGWFQCPFGEGLYLVDLSIPYDPNGGFGGA